jgi:peptide/nickel transport system ATP-binding protein
MTTPLLDVDGLCVDFWVGSGLRPTRFRALDDVSFSVKPGEILAVVGESGSGKSTLGRVVTGLVQASAGEVRFDGTSGLDSKGRMQVDRQRVQMVFQDPFASLNPAHTIFHHVARPLQLHGAGGDLRAEVASLLARCGLDPAEEYLDAYPHRLSGGQRQRVAIARALAPGPDLLIADEPTSMLDVSIRTDVLTLLRSLSEERGIAQILITHDLAAARLIADRILVLYAGRVMEVGPTESVIYDPLHPYAHLLLAAVAPKPGGDLFEPLPATGKATDKGDGGRGCPFAPRCPQVKPVCTAKRPSPVVPTVGLEASRPQGMAEAARHLFGEPLSGLTAAALREQPGRAVSCLLYEGS